MIAGFGGREIVRRQATAALADDDVRWAIELASWLVLTDDDADDRRLLAAALRTVAQRTSAANIRNWCITRALELDGTLDNSRLYRHRLTERQVLAAPITGSVAVLRVMLDPDAADGLDIHLGWRFDDGSHCGLHLRNGIAAVTDGVRADTVLTCTTAAWAAVLGGRTTLTDALANDQITIEGDLATARRALACFDVEGLRR
jgi:alkyl sulfatase BDS1-like metallo-beta-lactamase superfamily hydrolase